MTDLSMPSLGITADTAGRMQENAALQARARLQTAARSNARVEAAAKDFTGVFMSQMMQSMWEGVETDSMFGGGHGEDMMRGFFVQEIGKKMAANDSSGLSDAVKTEIIRMQSGMQNMQQNILGGSLS